MTALARSTDFHRNPQETAAEKTLGFQGPGASLASEKISRISTEIEQLTSRQVKTGQLELHVIHFRNGEIEKTDVSVLADYYRTETGKETIRKLLEAKAILEKEGINASFTIQDKEGSELAALPAGINNGAKPATINATDSESLLKSVAALIYGAGSHFVVVHSEEQSTEVDKFSPKLSLNKIIIPKIEIQEIIELRDRPVYEPRNTAAFDLDPLDELKVPNPPIGVQNRISHELFVVEGGGVAIASSPTNHLAKPAPETIAPERQELSFKDRLIVAKIRSAVEKDIRYAKENNAELRRGLRELELFLAV